MLHQLQRCLLTNTSVDSRFWSIRVKQPPLLEQPVILKGDDEVLLLVARKQPLPHGILMGCFIQVPIHLRSTNECKQDPTTGAACPHYPASKRCDCLRSKTQPWNATLHAEFALEMHTHHAPLFVFDELLRLFDESLVFCHLALQPHDFALTMSRNAKRDVDDFLLCLALIRKRFECFQLGVSFLEHLLQLPGFERQLVEIAQNGATDKRRQSLHTKSTCSACSWGAAGS